MEHLSTFGGWGRMNRVALSDLSRKEKEIKSIQVITLHYYMSWSKQERQTVNPL